MTQFKKLPQELALGRFRLIARLGSGGMAEVFLARLIGAGGFEKLVAIKRMLPEVSRNPTFVAMFLQEGRIAARLDHPNICQVYELGEDDGTLYLAMELLRGLPWSDIVPAIPDQPQHAAVRFIIGFAIQACDGLHHAHTAVGADLQTHPIVHRDVSPANLFVTNEGMVKLLDFGVSKVMTDATLTSKQVRKGKLPYMAPEQLHGHAVDARADVFSLAVVVWEALAGRALFDRASAYDTVMAVAQGSVPSLPGDGPVIAALDAALRRALARDRDQRPGSARELAHELRRAIAAHGEPMIASEIEAHLAQWVGPSLLRRSKNLAEILGRGVTRATDGDELSGEHTALHAAKPAAGARLRKVAVVVRASSVSDDLPTPRTASTAGLVTPTATHDTVIAPPLNQDMLAIPSSGPQEMAAIPSSGPQDTMVEGLPPTPPPPDETLAIESLTGDGMPTLPRAQPGYPDAPRTAHSEPVTRPGHGAPARHIAQPRHVAQLGHVVPPRLVAQTPHPVQPRHPAQLGRTAPDRRDDRSSGSPLGLNVRLIPIAVIAAIVVGVVAALLLV